MARKPIKTVRAGVVAERYAAETGDLALSPRTYEGDPDIAFSYALLDPAGGSLSVVAIDERSGGIRAHAAIAFFDPATSRWLFHREYVRRGEADVFRTSVIDQWVQGTRARDMGEARLAGRLILDVHNPQTKQVRRGFADTMRAVGALSWLQRDGVPEQLVRGGIPAGEPDESVIVYPTLATATKQLVYREQVNPLEAVETSMGIHMVGQLDYLAVSYRGLRTIVPDASGHTFRQDNSLIIAHRSETDPEAWVPELDVISPAEWQQLQDVPQALLAEKEKNRYFSAMFCGITYNNPFG